MLLERKRSRALEESGEDIWHGKEEWGSQYKGKKGFFLGRLRKQDRAIRSGHTPIRSCVVFGYALGEDVCSFGDQIFFFLFLSFYVSRWCCHKPAASKQHLKYN